MSFNPEYFYPTVITNIVNLNGGLDGTVKATDVYPAVDTTDLTQSPTGTTKPYQVVSLLNFILKSMGWIIYSPVLSSSTANLNVTYNNGASGVGATLTNAGVQAAFSLDGQTGILNARYVIAFQSSPAQNGIYTLTNIGSVSTNWVLTRSVDFNSSSNILNNGLVYVLYGSTYSNYILQDTFSGSITVGTTAINYAQWTFT